MGLLDPHQCIDINTLLPMILKGHMHPRYKHQIYILLPQSCKVFYTDKG